MGFFSFKNSDPYLLAIYLKKKKKKKLETVWAPRSQKIQKKNFLLKFNMVYMFLIFLMC
jgi:hypothetical protein